MPNPRTIVVFLGEPSKATELASFLADDEHAVQVAENTDDLYRLVHCKTIDLIVIDNHLPGFLTGVELLERLHTDLLRPAILLIAVAKPELNDRIRALHIGTVVSPAAGAAEIAVTARQAIVAERIGQVSIDPRARTLVQQADFVCPLPQLAVKYAGQLGAESCSIDEIARDIAVDPKMTALLLKLTNSAALGVRTKVTRTFEAVNLLGIRRTISLILSSSFAHAQSRMATLLPTAFQKWYFDRSILTAGAACAFARRIAEKTGDMAHVLGLLQDIGVLIFAYRNPNAYPAFVDRVRRLGQLRLEIAEQQEFAITHADVSAALLSKWELPQPLVKLVVAHHRPGGASSFSNSDFGLLKVMRVGEAFANLADNRNVTRSHLLNQLIAELGMTSPHDIKSCMAEAVSKAVESAKLLSIPVSSESTFRQLVA
jgi:HD-like signal output (HDOD) protein/CheY-like chemotaxis protein